MPDYLNPYSTLLDEVEDEWTIDEDDLADDMALPRGWTHKMRISPEKFYRRQHGE